MMDDVVERLKDIYRILKPGGIICIKDHDVKTKDEAKFVDFQHYVYELYTTKVAYYELAKDFDKHVPMNYFNIVELDKILRDVGFTRLFLNKNKNLTFTFEAVYKK